MFLTANDPKIQETGAGPRFTARIVYLFDPGKEKAETGSTFLKRVTSAVNPTERSALEPAIEPPAHSAAGLSNESIVRLRDGSRTRTCELCKLTRIPLHTDVLVDMNGKRASNRRMIK